jgi:hypothetical protein
MIVYPGSTVTVKAEPSESKTIVIVSGLASSMFAPGSPPTLLKAGQSLHLAPSDQMVIENDNKDPLVLIQIMIKDEG